MATPQLLYSRVNSAQVHKFFYPIQCPFSLERAFETGIQAPQGHALVWCKLLKPKDEYKAYFQMINFT